MSAKSCAMFAEFPAKWTNIDEMVAMFTEIRATSTNFGAMFDNFALQRTTF